MKKLSAIAAIAASAFAPSAFAAISLVNYDGFVVVQSGNTWNFHHESPENTALKGGTVYGRAGSAVDTVEPLTVKSRDVVQVGKGAVIDVVAKVPRANMARALIAAAKIGGRVGGGIVGGLAVEALIDYGLKNVKLGDDGTLQADLVDSSVPYEDSDGYYWRVSPNAPQDLSPYSACVTWWNMAYEGTFDGLRMTGMSVTDSGPGQKHCNYQGQNKYGTQVAGRYIVNRDAYSSCTPGKYIVDGKCVDNKPYKVMTEQELFDALASQSGWPTSSALALAGMLKYPDTRKILTPYPDNGVSLIGPPFVEGKTSTSTDTVQLVPGTNTPAAPGATQTQTGTRTTTTKATHPLTYTGNSVTHSTVNNTTTSITNNTTNVTTTESGKIEKVEDDSDEQTPSDAPLPDLPQLYEKKYPDGLSGVWQTRIQEIKSSGLFALAGQLMPTSLNGGTCPSFNIDLSIGTWADYGTHEVPVPCSIWDTCKYILLVLTVASARRLVFGG